MNPNATVFDIERFAVEDGPGIRSVVFFKGCNLNCLWCQNPESHETRPQVMYYRNLCVGCGRCIEVCPEGAIRDVPGFGFVTEHASCSLCGRCIDACFTNARKIIGRETDVDAIMEELLKDRAYYEESGGGVTFSGGEALMQSDAVAELARRCRAEGIHTALETAGFVGREVLETVLPLIDLVFFDLKHIDSGEHRKYTGVPLEPILENMKMAASAEARLVVRIPVVPGVNDDERIIRRMFDFLKDECGGPEVELLPFHRLGQGKYEGLGRSYAMSETPNLGAADCEPFADIGRSMGLTVRSGGGST